MVSHSHIAWCTFLPHLSHHLSSTIFKEADDSKDSAADFSPLIIAVIGIFATLVPHHHQQVLSPVQENPQREQNVAASEYQHRSHASVLVVQYLEEIVSLANDHVVPKTTTQDIVRERAHLENTVNSCEIGQDGIQQLRRSASLNCVSIADVLHLHDSEDDEDLENQMENVQFSMGIGSSNRVAEEQNSKSNNHRSGVFSLVKGPLVVKRTSAGRFVFTRYGKEKNSITPN
ncbi:unnamed protein product [Prunus armeniaca]